MGTKNQIKIESFTIERMYLDDIDAVIKLAMKAQSSFGITDTVSPSMFFREMAQHLHENMANSYIFKSENGLIFCAVIFRQITSVSSELSYLFFSPNVAQTIKMQDSFINLMNQLPFKEIYINVFKKRKKLPVYLRYIELFGFKEVMENNDSFVKIRYKTPSSYGETV